MENNSEAQLAIYHAILIAKMCISKFKCGTYFNLLLVFLKEVDNEKILILYPLPPPPPCNLNGVFHICVCTDLYRNVNVVIIHASELFKTTKTSLLVAYSKLLSSETYMKYVILLILFCFHRNCPYM